MKIQKFYGQTCNHAFLPVYSGKGHNSCKVFVSKFQAKGDKEMESFTFHEEFPSLDDCIQWALLQLKSQSTISKIVSALQIVKHRMRKHFMLIYCLQELPSLLLCLSLIRFINTNTSEV